MDSALNSPSDQPLIDQWNRVKRWREKVIEFKKRSYSEDGINASEMDVFYSYVVNIYSLKDWIIDCNPSAEDKIRNLYREKIHLRICTDYCNIIKHRRLNRPICDPNLGWLRSIDLPRGILSIYYIRYEFKHLTINQIKEAGIDLCKMKKKLGGAEQSKKYILVDVDKERIFIVADFSDYRVDHENIFGEYYEKLKDLFAKYPNQIERENIELFKFVDDCFDDLNNFLRIHNLIPL